MLVVEFLKTENKVYQERQPAGQLGQHQPRGDHETIRKTGPSLVKGVYGDFVEHFHFIVQKPPNLKAGEGKREI